jgi:hypothetical protein
LRRALFGHKHPYHAPVNRHIVFFGDDAAHLGIVDQPVFVFCHNFSLYFFYFPS